jgi:hypothetical protein
VLRLLRISFPWLPRSLAVGLDDIEYVSPATDLVPGYLEDTYCVHLNDRTETFSMIPVPGQQWLMEIKSHARDVSRHG